MLSRNILSLQNPTPWPSIKNKSIDFGIVGKNS